MLYTLLFLILIVLIAILYSTSRGADMIEGIIGGIFGGIVALLLYLYIGIRFIFIFPIQISKIAIKHLKNSSWVKQQLKNLFIAITVAVVFLVAWYAIIMLIVENM